MDKSEYRVKLDQITNYVNAGDYHSAQTIVDEVDWRRVKSARTLCMVSEIYEVNGRLLDSRKVLELAYKRALVKTVAYRLVEVCLKLKDLNAAQDYYDDFADLAPMDNSKYILKYKIHNAKGDPLDMQIKALEDYKEREYTEHWAYELAQLYSKNNDKDACVEACDDLILWFSEGPYVFKAMELKKKYAPLSPSQHEKYKNELAAKSVQAAVPSFIKVPEESKKPAASEGKETAAKEAVTKEAAAEEAQNEVPEETMDAEAVIGKMDAAASTTVQAEKGFKFSFNKGAAGAMKASLEPSRMQNQLADSIRNVFAGLNNKGSVQLDTKAEGVEASFEEVYQAEEDMAGYEIKDLEPEATPEEKEQAAEAVLSAPVTVEEEDDQIEGQMSFEDFTKKEAEFDFEALFAETTNALAKELASANFGGEEVVAETKAAPAEEPVAAEEPAAVEEPEAAEAPVVMEEPEAAEVPVVMEEPAAEAPEADELTEENHPLLYAKETDESLGLTREFDLKDQLKRKIVIDTAEGEVVLPEDFEVTFQMPEEEIKAEEPVESEEMAEAAVDAEEPVEESVEELIERMEEPLQEELITDPDLVVIQEENNVLEYLPLEPRDLTEEEKEIFTYFARIPGLGEQITVALSDIHNSAGDKTSRSGNFLVMGRQGSGKTRLYESMVLAVCKDLGMDAAKNAKILARDFNHKDPAAVVAKLAGGFLAIEGAGELSDEAAEKLAQAMEFRTDSLVVALEDEKEDLMNMLEKHPNLAEKFTSVVKIPVFTNDELVSFARIYAQDQGYRMDEMGVLALYTKIGDNQKDSEPVTVGKVKEMMDEAMLHANKGHRKLSRRFSKNAVDEDNRILLLEKDFE